MVKQELSRVNKRKKKNKLFVLKIIIISLLMICAGRLGAQALMLKEKNDLYARDASQESKRFPETETTDLNNYKQTVLEMVEDNQLLAGSVLVFKNGQTLINRGVGLADEASGRPNTSDSVYMMASIQKAFTSAAIMTLINQHHLTLDTKLASYFPEIPESDKISVKNLLDMTTNLTVEDYDKQATTESEALAELIAHIQLVPQKTKWKYETINYTLLAGIVRKITNETFQEYVQETLIRPLGLKHTGFYESYPKEEYKTTNYMWKWDAPEKSIYQKKINLTNEIFASELGSSNMYTTTEELLTFYRGLIAGTFFPAGNLKELWNPHTPPQPFYHRYTSGLYHCDGYKVGHGLMGGFETNVLFTDDGQTGVIIMGNSRSTKHYNRDFSKKIFEFISDYHYKVD